MSTPVADFDPNAATKPLWGVYDGYKFYTYEHRGHALTRLKMDAPGKIFELTSTGWELRGYRKLDPQDTCGCCGKVTGPSDALSVRRDWRTPHRDVPYWAENYCALRVNGKVTTPLQYLFACKGCIKGRGL